MRLAHLSDTHIDSTRRPADTERVHCAFIEAARAADVNLIVHAGDLFHHESNETERDLARRILVAAAEIAPVVLIRGNHDVAMDAALLSGQRTKHPVHIFTRPTLIGDSPLLLGLDRLGQWDGFGVICIPWFTRAGIAAKLPAKATIDEITFATNQAAAMLLTGAQMEAARIRENGAIPILLHHGEVVGWRKSATGYQPKGLTVAFGVNQLADVGCEYVALGHIHDGLANVWLDGRIAYAGSTERMDFGETEAKGWRLVTLDAGRFVRSEFVELPARKIWLIEHEFIAEAREFLQVGESGGFQLPVEKIAEPWDVEGAIVRFRFRVRAEDMHLVDEEAIRRALVDAGAYELKIEAVVEAQARVRCAEIETAESMWEEFPVWATATGKEIAPDRMGRLQGMFAQIEVPAKAGEEARS